MQANRNQRPRTYNPAATPALSPTVRPGMIVATSPSLAYISAAAPVPELARRTGPAVSAPPPAPLASGMDYAVSSYGGGVGATFYDIAESATGWWPETSGYEGIDDAIAGLGGLNGTGQPSGAGGSGSGESAATDSAGADSGASPDAVGDETGTGSGDSTGLLAKLLNSLEEDAAALGLSLEAYCDKIVADFPELPAILGIAATGAALLTFLYALRKKSGGTSTGGSKGATGARKRKRKSSVKASKSELKKWRAARGREGSISREEFVKWLRYGRQTPRERKSSKRKSSKRGKRVSFMADGKRITFWAKR